MDAVGTVDIANANVGDLADAAGDLVPWYMVSEITHFISLLNYLTTQIQSKFCHAEMAL
jgi:hypothetical protein